MPRYHFNIYDGIEALDREGSELADSAKARGAALRLASDLLRSEAAKAAIGDDWHIEVTDDQGMILFRLDIVMTGSAATR